MFVKNCVVRLWFIVNITVSETWADVVEWVYICSDISITLTYLLLCLDNCNKTIKTHCNDSSSIRMFGLSDEIWFAADERHSHSVDMMQWDAERCSEMQGWTIVQTLHLTWLQWELSQSNQLQAETQTPPVHPLIEFLTVEITTSRTEENWGICQSLVDWFVWCV